MFNVYGHSVSFQTIQQQKNKKKNDYSSKDITCVESLLILQISHYRYRHYETKYICLKWIINRKFNSRLKTIENA